MSNSRISQALLAFLVLAALCVGHIYLRFSISDMELQHCKLQDQETLLVQQQASLDHQYEVLCDMARLREYGKRDMDMVEIDSRTQVVAQIPEELVKKYSTPVEGVRVAEAAPAEGAEKVKQVLLTLVDANKAYAAEKSE